MEDLISREAVLDYLTMIPIDLGYREIKDVERFVRALPSVQPEVDEVARDIATIIENEKDMRVIASAQPIDVQEAYYRGKIDGVKECAARLKKVNEEFENGRSDK